MASTDSKESGVLWQVLYVKEPDPQVKEECLEVSTFPSSDIETVSEGQLLLRTTHVSIDPYLRGLMNKVSYTGGVWAIGKPAYGLIASVVELSKDPNFQPGDRVIGNLSWKAKQVVSAKVVNKIPTKDLSPSLFLSIFGVTGLSAYFPFKKFAHVKAGEVVFVSGAAGAVGTIFGQLAKSAGAIVYGSAGGSEKVELVKSLGFDDAFDYKKKSPSEGLDSLLNGKPIDVYFDNVGGETLEAVLDRMNSDGRIVCCGMISQYNLSDEQRYGVKNLMNIVSKRLTLYGFLISQWLSEFPQGIQEMIKLYAEQKLKHIETVIQGHEKIPAALVGLFQGENKGKMIVQVSEP